MNTVVETINKKFKVKRYKVQYPISAYTFPTETRIHKVRFDEDYIRIELTDERILSIPLWWIPTLYNALPEEREKYEINHSRDMIIWDPDKCGINDEIAIADYMLPSGIILGEKMI
jgi:hypothetical protein